MYNCTHMNKHTLIFFAAIIWPGIFSCSAENTPVYSLTTNVTPAESGSVSPARGEFDEGEQVKITVSANEHWVFTGWGGDYSGKENPVTIVMDNDKSVTALFEKKEYCTSSFLSININFLG